MGEPKKTVDAFLKDFRLEENGSVGRLSRVETVDIHGSSIDVYVNSFWTSRQRQASSIHEISYRACFKPQLPRFFMKLLSDKGDIVLDPFSGRGTTVIEAGLLGRNFVSNDINPLSRILSQPRFHPPALEDISIRLDSIEFDVGSKECGIDLSMFYHPKTLESIISLKDYLQTRKEEGSEDHVDRWIRMVATNRLTGHSKGFFSVYTLPPNQAVTPERQVRINERLDQEPPYRDVAALILKKSKSLLRNIDEVQVRNLKNAGSRGRFLEQPADNMSGIEDEEVSLTVTSPPFLNIVQYSLDNWLRCWFNGIDAKKVEKKMTMSTTVGAWAREMGKVFKELHRVTKVGGHLAFEVGEIKNREVLLEETIIPLGLDAGFDCMGVVINEQDFTKTSNIWGVSNNTRGTNTNRIALFRKGD
jgi:hypothetical protein